MENPESELVSRILLLRGQRVMLDEDLARIYGVRTMRLNEQVRRNIHRFPADFLFELSSQEAQSMRSQNAIASRRNIRHRPLAFTEHGAIMLAMVLNSRTAVEASVHVVRAFVKMREALSTQVAVQKKLDKIVSA